MTKGKGRYGSPEKRKSPRHNRKFRAVLEYEGKNREIRTIDISEHGVLIPRRIPPPVGTHITLTLTIRDETSIFKGVIKRHTKCLINGGQTTGIGIEFSSPGYQNFVRNNIIIA